MFFLNRFFTIFRGETGGKISGTKFVKVAHKGRRDYNSLIGRIERTTTDFHVVYSVRGRGIRLGRDVGTRFASNFLTHELVRYRSCLEVEVV